MNVLIYFSGPVPPKSVAPDTAGKVRFCNAKYFDGSVESAGVRRIVGSGYEPVPFDRVYVMPGCDWVEEIRAAYEAKGQKVETLEPENEQARPQATAKELGWTMKVSPKQYLERWPKGSAADLAKEVIEKLGGAAA